MEQSPAAPVTRASPPPNSPPSGISTPGGAMCAATTPRRTSSPSPARSARSTPWPAAARSRCGISSSRTRRTPSSWVRALGALTGNQAVQQVRAGLQAIYLSGWQVAADANLSGKTYPDQSLYPVNSVPAVVRRINNALHRAAQIEHAETGATSRDWTAPIVADAEAGFGGPLNAYELMLSMIEAGAAGVHWEDQLASEKKCGHMGGKVLVPTSHHVRTLGAARLAADVAGAPTVIIARTDALAANLLTSDIDERDQPFLTGERTAEGFYEVQSGHRTGDRPRPGLCGVRGSAVGRIRRAGPRAGPHLRRADPPRLPRTEARLQLLAELQLEAPPGRCADRLASSASWPRWATPSSSSPWPASTRSTTRCSSWPPATRSGR